MVIRDTPRIDYRRHSMQGMHHYRRRRLSRGAHPDAPWTPTPFIGSAEEEFADAGNKITLCYERIGDVGGEPMLLIAGLGQHLHAWPTQLCTALADRGFTVYRFDNRDVGRSTHMADVPPPGLGALLTGRYDAQQYTVSEMAEDTVGLLDALDLADAHLVGMSMGGMIGQTVAARHPERVRSLASLISNTGAKRSGRIAWSTWPLILIPGAKDKAAAGDTAVRIYRHIGARGFPFDEAWIRADAEAAFERDSGEQAEAGTGRQLAAILSSEDRTPMLSSVRCPTLVLHGSRDPMVAPSGGVATARAIPGARHATIAGMGHDLPAPAWPRIVDLIVDNARAADDARRTGGPVETDHA